MNMAGATDALIALTGTLMTVKVMSDTAAGVSPRNRKRSKRRRSEFDLM